METLRERIAVVTGGEKGIGRGIVSYLANRSWKVFAAGIDEAAGRLLESEFPNVEFIHCDVADEESVRTCMNHVVEKQGRIDGLVANAGIASPERVPLGQLDLEAWEQVIRVNLTGPLLCVKHACGAFSENGGSIVLIASTRATMSEPNTFAYSASKGGLVALAHSLAVSLGPKIRVNSVSPGWIHTGDLSTLEKKDHLQHPAGRVGKVEDIAAIVSYLLGNESGFVTGQDFVVDGGMTKKMIYEE